MSLGTFTSTNQRLTVSILELIRAVGSDGHYNSVHHTFRLREPYFVCKALNFTPTSDIKDYDHQLFFDVLHRNFYAFESSYLIQDFTAVDFVRNGKRIPFPAEERWVLTYIEPLNYLLHVNYPSQGPTQASSQVSTESSRRHIPVNEFVPAKTTYYDD